MSDDFASRLRQIPGLSQDSIDSLVEKVEQVLSYRPKVGVFGKTGAGKSSLCNAIFGEDVATVSDVQACTRNPEEYVLNAGRRGIVLLDCPGVGESLQLEQKYEDMHAGLLPQLDLVLWLIKADDRATATDEKFFADVVRPHLDCGKPLFVVISQSDKMEPCREWDMTHSRPGPNQEINLLLKQRELAALFGVRLDRVVSVSANEKYNIGFLVEQIIGALPNDKKMAVARQVKPETLSDQARADAERGFFEVVGEFMDSVVLALLKPLTWWWKS